MNYHGRLYGKLCGKYFDTGKTTDDWDKLERSNYTDAGQTEALLHRAINYIKTQKDIDIPEGWENILGLLCAKFAEQDHFTDAGQMITKEMIEQAANNHVAFSSSFKPSAYSFSMGTAWAIEQIKSYNSSHPKPEQGDTEGNTCTHPKDSLRAYHDLSVICNKCHEVIWQVDWKGSHPVNQWNSNENPLNSNTEAKEEQV